MNLILLRAQLRGLSAFRSLLDTPMLKDALQLLDAAARRDGEGALAAYDQMFYLLKAEGYSGLGTWMWDTLRYTVDLNRHERAVGFPCQGNPECISESVAHIVSCYW